MRREPVEQGRRWLAQAEADLAAAYYNFDGEKFYVVCFLAQQSAEKAIKAYLYATGEERVIGHAVTELLNRAGGTFESLGEDAPILDAYYLPSRYPDSLPGGIPAEVFGRSAAQAALDISKRVLDLAGKELDNLDTRAGPDAP
ncbi:HEPN domain-containing protein [soil metagenome]